MPYGFYLRKKRQNYRKIGSKAKAQNKAPVVVKYNYPKKKMSFAKRVNQIISRNNENKFTKTATINNPVALRDQGNFSFFTWQPALSSASALFNLPVGPSEGQRIGNTIKLKRWIIKGLIQPKYNAGSGDPLNGVTMNNSYVGYVDIYFGKYLKNNSPVSSTLGALYQNGSTTSSPTCISTDMLNPLNKDVYKVYYHRRFKMGAASDPKTYQNPTASDTNPANNDFKVSQTFGFDVCKYILKNKALKYNDGGITAPYEAPQNNDIENLSVWATFTPLQGTISNATGTRSYTFWYIDCLSYAEYEDA
jgi:hypothetical protein